MRSVDAWVRRWWRGEAGWGGRMASVAFLPGEWLFRAASAGRNRLFDAGLLPSRSASVPVLSVGNLTVGGTGKTPVVRWFVDALLAAGAVPAVVARGYGRDELLLHRRWHAATPVVAHPDRWEGVRRAQAAGADVAVLDDGFQHRALERDLDVVLVAAETPFPGRRLPRGPYREGPRALARADLIVVTRKTASEAEARSLARTLRTRCPEVPVARIALAPGGWQGLDGAPCGSPAGPALVVTAVADPEGVRRLAARALASPLDEIALDSYPDHHEFSADDLHAVVAAGRGRALIVTEKDAVKLRSDGLPGLSVHVLTLGLSWEEGREAADAAVARLLAARRAP